VYYQLLYIDFTVILELAASGYHNSSGLYVVIFPFTR